MRKQKRQIDAHYEPILRSAAMKSVDQVLQAVAGKDVTLTLIGESGVGKEVLARRAHELSLRRSGPFIPINCAAIPEALFESELFGHERGAFTGATGRVRGKVEAAEGGTLFFDEIGEMPITMQAKLLRFLENRRYMRVGGSTKLEADVRLMFATLRSIEKEVSAGRFRADLYYRIQGITLTVPPLRERRADINPLLKELLVHFARRHSLQAPKLTRQVKSLLVAYDWPGNVRELKNVVESLCVLRDGRRARVSDLPESLRPAANAAHSLPPGGSILAIDLKEGLAAAVQRLVEAALLSTAGDTAQAAALLRVSPRTVQRHLAAGKARTLPKQ